MLEESATMAETLYLKQMECGPMQNYVYLIGDPATRQAAVVDPAWDVERIVQAAQQDGYTISKVLITTYCTLGTITPANPRQQLARSVSTIPTCSSQRCTPFCTLWDADPGVQHPQTREGV
jgi:hypothetical protein